MELENKNGQMVPFMKENGLRINLMERGNWFTLMEMFTKGNGNRTKLMGRVFISM